MTPRATVPVYRAAQKLLNRVRLAASFWERWRGLLYFRQFPEFDGLLLYPCNQVHGLGLRFPLDLVLLDRQRQVVAVFTDWEPNQISPRFKEVYYVLEVRPGTIERYQIKPGDSLWW